MPLALTLVIQHCSSPLAITGEKHGKRGAMRWRESGNADILTEDDVGGEASLRLHWDSP